MKEILKIKHTEIMVNFMYYRIIMDLNNPRAQRNCEKLFSPDTVDDVKEAVQVNKRFNVDRMLEYLYGRLDAKYYTPFKVHFGLDEKVSSGRVKYLLIHYSNHFKAFKCMLDIMWKHSEEGKPLSVRDSHAFLFPLRDIKTLEEKIEKCYIGSEQEFTFDNFIKENWGWFFPEKHYRNILKKLEKDGNIKIERIDSSRNGLKGCDKIIFYK